MMRVKTTPLNARDSPPGKVAGHNLTERRNRVVSEPRKRI
jgi:hypothetical protein